MKKCNNCKKDLEVYLCDVPKKWRDQIISVICDYIDNQEFPCKDILTCLNDEMGTLDAQCLTNSQQEWDALNWYDKMNLIITKICEVLNLNNLFTENTSTLQLFGLGINGDPLFGNIVLSDDVDQIAEIRADGLYVPSNTYTADRGVQFNTSNNIRLVDIEDGAGTHFLWNYSKNAFRAGITTSTQWNDANIGIGSAAFGRNNTATGAYSGAFGNTNTILSTGLNAFVAGYQNSVNQINSAAFGNGHSVLVNTGTSGSEGGGFTAGIANQLLAGVNYAIGTVNIIKGNYSGSIGYDNQVDGEYAHCIGKGLRNTSLNGNLLSFHTIIGNYNEIASPDDTDILGGNGYTEDVAVTIAGGYEVDDSPNPPILFRSDALKIYKTGNVKFYGAIDQRVSTRGIMAASWTTANRPASPIEGEMGYNTTDNTMEYHNGTTWIQF